jgi:hypothetical protein
MATARFYASQKLRPCGLVWRWAPRPDAWRTGVLPPNTPAKLTINSLQGAVENAITMATIATVTADGAYCGMPTYEIVGSHGEDV